MSSDGPLGATTRKSMLPEGRLVTVGDPLSFQGSGTHEDCLG